MANYSVIIISKGLLSLSYEIKKNAHVSEMLWIVGNTVYSINFGIDENIERVRKEINMIKINVSDFTPV